MEGTVAPSLSTEKSLTERFTEVPRQEFSVEDVQQDDDEDGDADLGGDRKVRGQSVDDELSEEQDSPEFQAVDGRLQIEVLLKVDPGGNPVVVADVDEFRQRGIARHVSDTAVGEKSSAARSQDRGCRPDIFPASKNVDKKCRPVLHQAVALWVIYPNLTVKPLGQYRACVE